MRFEVTSKAVHMGDEWQRKIGFRILWLNLTEPNPYEWSWMDVESAKTLMKQLEDCIAETPILPCPFCNSDSVHYQERFDMPNTGEWAVGRTIHSTLCKNCGAEVCGKDKDDAVRKWNTRGGKRYDGSD